MVELWLGWGFDNNDFDKKLEENTFVTFIMKHPVPLEPLFLVEVKFICGGDGVGTAIIMSNPTIG